MTISDETRASFIRLIQGDINRLYQIEEDPLSLVNDEEDIEDYRDRIMDRISMMQKAISLSHDELADLF